jgi:hypothetical protein
MGNDDGKLPLSGRRECKIVAAGVAFSILHDQMPGAGAQSLAQRNGTFDEEACLGLLMLTES